MEKLVAFLTTLSGPMPYVLVFSILLACGLGLPIPEDITLFAAGLLSYYGEADVYLMIAVSLFGVLFGDSIIFILGAKFGPSLTRRWFFRRVLTPERIAVVKRKLHRKGNRVIFAARFMPGLRAPIYFTAGTLHLPFRVFIFYDGLAALISVPAIVYSVYYFGDSLDYVIKVIRNVQNGILLLIAGLIALGLSRWYVSYKRNKKGERVRLNDI